MEKRYIKKIEILSYENQHDEMTGVYNRAYFDDRLKETLIAPICVLNCDIDNLKEINDHYGHDIGDLQIIKMASVLENDLQNGAFCARIGGDEFCVFFQNTDENIVKDYVDRIKIKARNIRMKELNFVEEIELHFFIGYSYSTTEYDIFSMLREADQRMYSEKYEHKKEKMFI